MPWLPSNNDAPRLTRGESRAVAPPQFSKEEIRELEQVADSTIKNFAFTAVVLYFCKSAAAAVLFPPAFWSSSWRDRKE